MTVNSRCPRPDKLAFDTEEEAADRYKSLLLSDLTMSVYLCRCRKWHAGRREENVEAHQLANAPVLKFTSPAPETLDERPARRRRSREVHRASPVTSIVPDEELWKDALLRADGDASRIQVISATKVMIHNNGNWRKRRRKAS